MPLVTPRRLLVFGIACLVISGLSISIVSPSSAAVPDPNHSPARTLPPLQIVADVHRGQPLHQITPIMLQRAEKAVREAFAAAAKKEQENWQHEELARRKEQLLALNITGDVRPEMYVLPSLPPGLSSRENITAQTMRHLICPPLPNQTLHSPNGSLTSLRIVAAGLARSGSTWQFNAIVAILKEAGILPATSHGLLSDYPTLGLTFGCPFAVIKTHQFHPYYMQQADYVFTSHRDPRDSFGSLVEMTADEYFAHYWGEYLRWAPFACIDMNYEQFYANQLREIERLVAALPVPKSIDAKSVLLRIEQERVKAAKGTVLNPWHAVSGYHRRHITDPEPGRWQKLLTSNATRWGPALAYIETTNKEWLLAHGYEPKVRELLSNLNVSLAPLQTPPFLLPKHTPPPEIADGRCPLPPSTREAAQKMLPAFDFFVELQGLQQARIKAAELAAARKAARPAAVNN